MEFFRGTKPRILKHNKKIIKEETAAYTLTLEEQNLNKCSQDLNYVMCECFPGHVSVICQICSEICHKGHPIKMKLKNSLLMSNYLKCLCGGTIHKSTGIMTEPSFKIMKNIDKCMENHINEEEDEMDGEDCSIQEDSENEGYKTVRLISRLLENSKEFRELKPERKNKEKLKYLNKLETFYYTIYPKNEYYNNLPGVFKSNDIADYSKIDMKSIENEDYLSIAKELTFYLSNEELNSKKKLNIFSFYHLNTVKNLFAKYNEVLKCLYKKSVQEKNSIFEFLKGASNKDLMKFQSESNLISLNIESKKNTKQIKLFNNDFLDLIFNIIDKESTFHEFDEKYLSGITYNFIIFVILSINKNLNHYNLLKINHVVKSSKEYYNQLSKSVKKVISFRDEEDNYNDSDSINELNKKHENIKDANTSDYEDNPDSDKTGIEGNFTSYIFCNRVITMFNVFHKVVIRKYISCVNELDFQSYLNLNIATRKIYFHDLVNILDSFNKDNTNALCYDFREMYFKTLVDILKIMIINSQKDLMIQAYLHINIKAISIIFLDASKFNLANLDILESYFKLIDKYFNVFTIKQDEMLSFYNIISETIFYYLMFKVDKRIIDHISCVYVESNENKINKVEDLFNDYDKILRTDQSFKINDKEDDENEYLNTNSDRDLNTTKDTLHTTTNKTNFKYPFELDESSISLIMTISKLFLEVQKHSSCQKRNVYGRFIHNTSKFALKTQLFTYNPDLNSNLKKSCRKNSISDIEHNLDDIKAISLLGYLNIELISGSFDNNYNSLRNILESNGVTEILNAKQYLDLRLPIFKNSLDYNDQVVIDYSSISSDNDMIHYFIKIIKENETNTYSNNNFSSKMKEWIDNFNSKINQIFNNNNESNKEPFLLKAKESFFLNSNNIIDIERLKNFQNQVIFSKFITYLDKFILIYLSNNLSFLDEVEAKDTEAFYDEIRLKNKNSNRKLTRTMSQKLNTKKIKFKSHLCFNDSQIKNNLMNKLLNIILGISYFNTQVISLILSLQYQSFARLFSKANQGYFNFLNNFSVFFSYNMNKKSITNYTYYNFSFLIEQIIMTNNNNDTVVSLTKTMSLEENDEDIEYSKLILLENKSKKFSTLPLENMIKLSDSNSDRNQIEEMISECFNDSTQQENYFKSITFILNISSCLLNYKDLHLRSLNKLILHVKSLLDKIISNKNLVKALEACLLFPQILREDLIINQFFISYFKFLNTLKSNNNESFIGIIDVNNLIIRRFILLNLNISPKVLDRDEKNEGLIQENIYYYNKELFFLIQEYIFNHLVFFDSSVAGNKLILKNLYKLKFPKQELNEVLNKKKMNLKWNFMGSVTNGNTFYGEYSQKNLLTGKRLNLIDDDIKKELDEALKRKEGDDNEYEEINYRLVDLDLNYIINTDTHDSNGTGRDYFLETIQIYSKSFDDLIERVLYVSEFAIKNIIYDLNNNDSDDISFYNINQCHSRFSKLILTPFFRLIQNLNIKMNYFIKNQEEICKSRIIVCVLINKLYEYTLLFYEAENRFRESICESKKSDYLNTNINEYLITKSIDNLDLLKSIIYEHEDLFKKSIVISDESTRTSLNEYFNNNEDCVFEKLDLLKYINTVIANKTDVFNLKNSKNVFNEDYSINNEVSDEEVVDLFIKTNPNLKLRLNNYNIISCATHRPVNFRNLGGSDKNEINTNINLSSEKVKQFSCIEEAFDSILSPFNSLINFDDNNSDTDEENINTSMRITDINEDVFKKILGKFSETLNIILRKKIIHNINGSIDHFKHLTTINETINTIEKEKYQVLNTYCKVSNSIKYGNLYNTSINYLFASNIPLAKKTFLHIFYQLKFDPLSNNKLFCKDPSFSELSNDFILKIKYINNLFKYDKKLSKDIIEEIFIDDNNEILNNYFTGLMKAIIIYYYCAFDTFNYTYSVDILNVINTNNNSFLEKLKHIANEDKENINVRYEMNNVFEIELFGLSYSEVLKEFLQNMFLSNKIVKIFLEMNFLNIVADYTEENMMRELDLNKEHKISSVLTNSEYVDYNNTIASNTINYENSLVNNNENLNSNQKVLFKMVNEISKDNMNEINDDMKKTINDFLQIILKKDNEKNTDNKANIEGKEDNSLVNFNFSFFNYIYLLVDFSVLFTTKEMFDFTYKEKILKNTTNSILTLNLKDNIYIRSKSKSDHTDVSLYSYILDNLNNLTQLKHSDSSNYITSFISYDYQDYYIRNNFVYLLSFCFENSDKVFQPFNKMLIYYLYKSIKMLNFMLKMNLFNEAGISKLVDQKVFNLPEKIKFLINVVVEKYRYNLEYKDSSLLEKVKENDKSNPKSNGIEEFVRLYFNFKRIISNENKLNDLSKEFDDFKSIIPELRNYCYDIVFAYILELFLFLIFLVKKLKYNDVYMEVFNELDNAMSPILKRCNFIVFKYTDNEVKEQEKLPMTLFQYIDPKCSVVTNYENSKFLETVDRSTPLSKIKGLLNLVEIYQTKVEFDQNEEIDNKVTVYSKNDSNYDDGYLVKKNRVFPLNNNPADLQQVSNKSIKRLTDNLLEKDHRISSQIKEMFYDFYDRGFHINFLIVIGVNFINMTLTPTAVTHYSIDILNYIVLILSSIFILLFLKFKYLFKVEISKKNYNSDELNAYINNNTSTIMRKMEKYSLVSKIKFFISSLKNKILCHITQISNNTWSYLFESFLFDSEVYYFVLCFIFSLLSIFVSQYTPLFYSFLLIGIIKYNVTTKSILSAFMYRKDQILCMLALLILLINCYSSYGFFYIQNEYIVNNEDTDNQNVNLCSSLLSCETSFFNYGVRSGGGIGDILTEKTYDEGLTYFLRLGADLVFYITITLLVINMFSGIIIETFGSLREEADIQNDDIKNNCFICSVRSVEFKRRNIDFNNHVNTEHKLDDYIKVILTYSLMSEKDAQFLDSNERYIWDCIQNKRYECFPINTISIGNRCEYIENEE